MWLRLTSYLESTSTLGPLIRMMGLMAKDVGVFLALLLMYIFGFAGTFYVWFYKIAAEDDAGSPVRAAPTCGRDACGDQYRVPARQWLCA